MISGSAKQAMERSLARAIFRESRQLRRQKLSGFQLPAIYDICNSVNPSCGGILLGDRSAYRSFVKSYFEQWCIAQELGEYSKLRKLLPGIIGEVTGAGAQSTPLLSSESGKNAGVVAVRCPFEVLRAFKFQNSMGAVSSEIQSQGIILSGVTGYARRENTVSRLGGLSGGGNGTNTTDVMLEGDAAEEKAAEDGFSSYTISNSVTPSSSSSQVEASPAVSSSFANAAESVDHGEEHIFSYNILVANKRDHPVRILGHNIVFKYKGKELKTEGYHGVNNTLPVIGAGEYYVCGATVAFPVEMEPENLTVGGSFEMFVESNDFAAESGNESKFWSEMFESLSLEKKWKVLKSCVEHGSGTSFTAELLDTNFSLDVVCDMQPLSEKFGLPETTSDTASVDVQY